jgi:hypothetical protein
MKNEEIYTLKQVKNLFKLYSEYLCSYLDQDDIGINITEEGILKWLDKNINYEK